MKSAASKHDTRLRYVSIRCCSYVQARMGSNIRWDGVAIEDANAVWQEYWLDWLIGGFGMGNRMSSGYRNNDAVRKENFIHLVAWYGMGVHTGGHVGLRRPFGVSHAAGDGLLEGCCRRVCFDYNDNGSCRCDREGRGASSRARDDAETWRDGDWIIIRLTKKRCGFI